MAEFKVTISDMNEAATNISNQSENFRTASSAMLTAAQELTEKGGGWDDDASKIFQEKIREMDTWIKNMSEIIDEYSANLNTSAQTYTDADEIAAKNFRH